MGIFTVECFRGIFEVGNIYIYIYIYLRLHARNVGELS